MSLPVTRCHYCRSPVDDARHLAGVASYAMEITYLCPTCWEALGDPTNTCALGSAIRAWLRVTYEAAVAREVPRVRQAVPRQRQRSFYYPSHRRPVDVELFGKHRPDE